MTPLGSTFRAARACGEKNHRNGSYTSMYIITNTYALEGTSRDGILKRRKKKKKKKREKTIRCMPAY